MKQHPPKIFLSYRHRDRPRDTGDLRALLAATFGAEQVFQDDVAIPPGADFVAVIEQEVTTSDVLLAVIGPDWLTALGGRLDDPDDLLRREIEWALQSRVPVVPVLLDTEMPSAAALPATLAPLAGKNAVPIDGRRFAEGARRLVEQLTRMHYGDRPDIVPGRSVAGIALGARASVERNLDPAERRTTDDGEVEYRFRDRGLQVYALDDAVGGFFLSGIDDGTDDEIDGGGWAAFPGRTENGIGVGSARSAVESAYGRPSHEEFNRGDDGFDAAVYSERGIAFCYSTLERGDPAALVAAIVVRPAMSIDNSR